MALDEPEEGEVRYEQGGLTFLVDEQTGWWISQGHAIEVSYNPKWQQLRVGLAGQAAC